MAKRGPKKGSKRKSTAGDDFRAEVMEKLARVNARLDTINRRYFAGSNKTLIAMEASVETLSEEVSKYEAAWVPKRKGKNALIIGSHVRLKEELDAHRLEAYKHMGGVERYHNAKITLELDNRTFVVQLKDGTKTVVPKRDVIAEPIEEKEPPK